MDKEVLKIVDFIAIRDSVRQFAISGYAKKEIDKRHPSNHLQTVEKRLDETNEAVYLLNGNFVMPFMGLTNIESMTQKVTKGYVLDPQELIEYADFLRSIRLIRQFLLDKELLVPRLASYAKNLRDFNAIVNSIESKISNNRVRDDASKELKKTRQQLTHVESDISVKLKKFLSDGRYASYIQEKLIVQKQDTYTVPVKHSFKNKVPGKIVEESNKGLTVYIEPETIQTLSQEREVLKQMEEAYVYHILSILTGEILDNIDSIMQMIEIIVEFDVIFARAKYSRTIDGTRVNVNKSEHIHLINAKHPLLGHEAVPLSVEIGQDYRVLMITGANAGGKTVVLKTVALLTVMTMYGLLIPADSASQIAVMDHIFASIGDQQSLENSLSTFSGQLKNLANILNKSERNTLLILDEIGSGTDPKQGASLAISILNTLYLKGAIMLVSTHYGELKKYAQMHEDFQTASMIFDTDSLQPTYHLQVGESGDSYAFWLADKMGISDYVIEQANLFMKTNEYPVTIGTFKQHSPKEKHIQPITFEKGDTVWASNLKKEGIFYSLDAQNQIGTIFVEKQMIEVPLKRLTKLIDAEKLYPKGYNLDLLFITDYQQYKLNRDLLRGSKKAWKHIKKEK